jgi:hypothetical protein
MFSPVEVGSVREALASLVRRLDAAALSPVVAQRLVADFAAVENLGAAAKALCARRVAESESWRTAGHRSAAHWLAKESGTTITAASEVLATAERLDALPVVDDAARSGRLNAVQVREVACAAAVEPLAQEALVRTASRVSLVGLRNECRRVRTAALSAADQEARYRAIHEGRFHRHWTDDIGAVCGQYRLTPDAGARFLAALDTEHDRIFRAARSGGMRESSDAYAADALVALASRDAAAGDGAARRPVGSDVKVIMRIDHTAFVRGHTAGDEICEIAGIGPVPVSVVRHAMDNAFLAAVVTKGVDVTTVAHLGRRATAHQRTALQWRDPECAVEDCHRTARLEIDHRHDWARTRRTKLDELDRLCDHHHQLKTRHGWHLAPGTGKRPMHPPSARRAGTEPKVSGGP